VADVTALDAKTGQPIVLPQEAVATHYKAGKIYFPPGTRVPVRVDGQEGTLDESELDTAIHDHDAELNFDPSGATKAAAAGAVRGLSAGTSDWLAIEGMKLLGNREGAEKLRLGLQGLREEHPTASTVGEIGGALASIPLTAGLGGEAQAVRGGAEGVDLAQAGAGAADAAKAAVTTGESAQMGAALRDAGAAAQGAAAADASSGRTVGSALGTLFRHAADPMQAVGAIGNAAETHVARLFGDSALAGGAGKLARWTTEGGILGAANAADESELGDENLTGEAMWTAMEHGALFGTGLGLVGVGAEKALLGAGKLASRVAEGRLGGTAAQYRRALERHGVGTLGQRALEEGIETPFATAREKFERAQAVVNRDGQAIDGVVREADANYGGVNAAAARRALHEHLDRATEEGGLAGGNLGPLNARIKREFDDAIGWKGDPEPMPPIPAGRANQLYEEMWQRAGLPDPATIRAPAEVTRGRMSAMWREMAEAEGIGTKMERGPKRLSAEQVASFREAAAKKLAATVDPAERGKLTVMFGTPGGVEKAAVEEADIQAKLRNARRQELRQKATDDLNARYARETEEFDRVTQAHRDFESAAAQKANAEQAEQDRLFAHSVSARRRANAEIKVPLASVRSFRQKLDGIIPYNRGPDALTNAAVDMKLASRRGLEQHVEEQMDRIAQKAGKPELYAQYVHAKARYGQAKDIEAMLEKQRGREASWFGREVFGHHGGIVGHALGAAMFGHPIAGAAVGIAKQYAPTLAAFLAHKMARFAEMKALRSELLVAMRRSGRASVAGREVPAFATLAVPNLPPHELRATAADAMVAIAKMARGTDLKSRLAILDPSLNVLAPKTAMAQEGAARRALTWLMGKVPARVQAALAQGQPVSSRDLSDSEARDFMEASAVTLDPRVLTDALAQGKATPTMVATNKFVQPFLHAQLQATLQREHAMDRGNFDRLTPGRKAQLGMVTNLGAPETPGMTMALQRSAAALAAGAARQSPQGKVNSASGLSKMSGANLMQTQSDAAASSTPGRRGKAQGSLGP
jgi:hypothetical protein